jgi:HEAT repeat protein
VQYLATEGNEDAKEALFEFIKVPSLSIRRAAVQAILTTMDNKTVRRQLISLLPADQHFLLDIQQGDVREVEQIKDPESHLLERAREAVTEPPPGISGEPEGESPRAYK